MKEFHHYDENSSYQIHYVDDIMSTYSTLFSKSYHIGPFSYFPGDGVGCEDGDGWGKIKNKDHLSPAEAETGTELGN